MSIIIEAQNLKKIYQSDGISTQALSGISFKVERGEFLAIMGPSGSGKSTLMHIMGFLDSPTSGTYLFEGKNIKELGEEELARIRNKRMGFVFQAYNLLPRTTVFDNISLPLIYGSDFKKEEGKRKVREAIQSVGLSQRIDFYPNQLSGGEQQRVAIARALVNNPSVIFADEPTGNLDSKSGHTIISILQELNEKGHTIVLVTHERYTAEHAQRIIHLKDGKIIADEKIERPRKAKEEKGLLK